MEKAVSNLLLLSGEVNTQGFVYFDRGGGEEWEGVIVEK